MKDIRTVVSINRNSKGELHGYQESYSNLINSTLFRAKCKNGYTIGYAEYQLIKKTIFHII